MASIKPDIKIIRGDSASIAFEFTESGSPADLAGAIVFFTAKPDLTNDITDSTAVIAVEVTDHTDPAGGKTTIPLSDNDTDVTPGIYWYDIQVKRSDGTIASIPARKLEIVADVTRRES